MLALPAAVLAQGIPAPRLALVIGNSGYTGMPRLANPRNDAEDVKTDAKTPSGPQRVLRGGMTAKATEVFVRKGQSPVYSMWSQTVPTGIRLVRSAPGP